MNAGADLKCRPYEPAKQLPAPTKMPVMPCPAFTIGAGKGRQFSAGAVLNAGIAILNAGIAIGSTREGPTCLGRAYTIHRKLRTRTVRYIVGLYLSLEHIHRFTGSGEPVPFDTL
jgi:hypothetical protein